METFIFGGEEGVSLSRARVCVFSDSLLSLAKMSDNPQSTIVREVNLMWFSCSSHWGALDRIDSEPTKFEWNIFQDSPHCSSATKSKSSCQK